MNILEMKCLGNLVGVSRMDLGMNGTQKGWNRKGAGE